MKLAGRKKSAAYELYGFIPKVENGKHSAICKSCNRVLQNTAAVRLEKHRNSCVAARSTTSGDSDYFPNLQMKRRIMPKPEAIYQNESTRLNVKTEHCNMEFEDANINYNANGNTSSEDTMDNLQDYNISSHKSTTKKDRTDDKLKARIQYFKQKSKYYISETNNLNFEKTMMVLKVKKLKLEIQQLKASNPLKRLHKTSENDETNICTVSRKSKEPSHGSYQENDSIQSPVTTRQPLREPFESYRANITTSPLDIVDKIEEVNEDLINMEEELDVIQNLMPRSKESKQLQDELSKAETQYYRCKTAYFTKLTENCKIKRTLMLLESRKLQLEIEKLTNES